MALVVACQVGPGGPAPSLSPPVVSSQGKGANCSDPDHGIFEAGLGWSFCYPGTWKFQERLQPTSAPRGVDATFDITNAAPVGTPGSGDFGFMIISTDEIGGAADLRSWVTTNIGPGTLTPIQWGDAREAVIDSAGRRFALTPHHVVEMDVRGDAISAEMVKRLPSWKFLD